MNYDNVKAHIHPKSAAQRQRTLPYGHQCSLCIIWNILFYHKLERKCIANACQFVIIYYKLGRSCSANAFQFVIIYYKLGRNCITYAFQFVIIYYKLERYYKLGRNRGNLLITGPNYSCFTFFIGTILISFWTCQKSSPLSTNSGTHLYPESTTLVTDIKVSEV